MEDKITLDKETFKALAVDTRVEILKRLDDEHQLTLTDLSQGMGMAPSTIKEHLGRLMDVGLIKQLDKGTKWKYYRLTGKGKQLLNPYEKRVWVVLSASMILFFAALHRLFYRLNEFMAFKEKIGSVPDYPAGEGTWNMAASAPNISTTIISKGTDIGGMITSTTGHMAREAFDEASAVNLTSATLPLQTVAEKAIEIPYAELTLSLIFVLIAGICVGYLIRRKRII